MPPYICIHLKNRYNFYSSVYICIHLKHRETFYYNRIYAYTSSIGKRFIASAYMHTPQAQGNVLLPPYICMHVLLPPYIYARFTASVYVCTFYCVRIYAPATALLLIQNTRRQQNKLGILPSAMLDCLFFIKYTITSFAKFNK